MMFDKLFEKTWVVSRETSVNEIDIRKVLRTAAVTGALGGAAFGLGYRKGLALKAIEKPTSTVTVEEPAEKISVDMKKIVTIESRNNPKAENPRTGAKGLHQIMKPTWEEMTQKMGVDWSWNEAFDVEKNTKVAEYYMNTEIPRLLKHFGIEDTIENRLAAYNWGVGNLHRLGLEKAPQETLNYIEKYKSL